MPIRRVRPAIRAVRRVQRQKLENRLPPHGVSSHAVLGGNFHSLTKLAKLEYKYNNNIDFLVALCFYQNQCRDLSCRSCETKIQRNLRTYSAILRLMLHQSPDTEARPRYSRTSSHHTIHNFIIHPSLTIHLFLRPSRSHTLSIGRK